jgi:RNA polymerase primary sigma factor
MIQTCSPARGKAPCPHHAYLRRIQEMPALSREEEEAVARRVQRGDWEARARLVCANLRLVPILARTQAGKGLDLDDLIAEGNLGLLRAVETFDPAWNTRFATYATYWINEAMRRALANYGRVVRLPAYVVGLLARWRRAGARLRAELGRPPADKEIAHCLGLSARKVILIRRALRAEAAQPLESADRAGPPAADCLPDPRARPPAAALIEAEEVRHAVACLGQLGHREAFVLRLRYGLDREGPKTLRETARRLGLSREGVRQLERQALRKVARTIGGEP